MEYARSMLRWFWVFWLVLVLGTVVMLAVGGRPDPAGLGETLNGAWRFHAGDDPAWASPATDDRGWDRIALVSNPDIRDGDVGIPGYLDGWHARGHPALDGYGWYRRQVTLPQQGDPVLVGPPLVDDAYEMFWNGHPIGGVGRPAGSPNVTSTRPMMMRLPASGGTQTATLAIRAYMQPGFDRDAQSGGLRTVPVLASSANGAALYRAEWRRWIAGYVVDAAEPAAMLVLAAIAVFAAPALARPGFARWAAFALAVSACGRLGNAIIAWTDLESLRTLLWQNGVVLGPLAKLAWTIAWNQWTDGRSRRFVAYIAVAAWVIGVAGALTQIEPLAAVARAVFAVLLVAIAARIARHGAHRALALTAMVLTSIGLFAGDLSALGVPGIWFPFDIGVSRSQYAYALALPLLAFALAASAAHRREQG
jgi:hypothetical protein